MRFYSSINALRSCRSTLYVAANLIHQWVTPSGDRSLEAGILLMTGARSNVTHRDHNQVVHCWLTSDTGTAPPNESRPRGMLFGARVQRKGEYIGRLRPYDKGWDDHDEMIGMPTCAEIAWHSGAILVEIIVVSIMIEYHVALQALVPQAPRKQLHRQLEWVEAPWDGRDTHTMGP
ncbi:uncharacterized protein EI90DRAFT_3080232 [Cantharellus anzutake]|uniref:uncharacterized protein n=1 Tax=Cantharellus anzutake TaxID=1750568 RepID=UPI001903596D|nr:uncharacterized protein EI90DRAFT_3080232 [Cantharellus anzutake]KAF8321026.1 hypothetical protein EI90DRAFT_3080232 [Cantharellus anzutake]